jgi:hypothetical protein
MNRKSLIIFLYFAYTFETKYRNLAIFPIFVSHLVMGKLQNHLIFLFLKFEFRFLEKKFLIGRVMSLVCI